MVAIYTYTPLNTRLKSLENPRKMNKKQFIDSLEQSISSLPNIIGINNHMGSLLTTSNKHMKWLMEILQHKNLLFIDSRTTSDTIAESIAKSHHIPVTRRNVFLDHSRELTDIKYQYKRFFINKKIEKRLVCEIIM